VIQRDHGRVCGDVCAVGSGLQPAPAAVGAMSMSLVLASRRRCVCIQCGCRPVRSELRGGCGSDGPRRTLCVCMCDGSSMSFLMHVSEERHTRGVGDAVLQ